VEGYCELETKSSSFVTSGAYVGFLLDSPPQQELCSAEKITKADINFSVLIVNLLLTVANCSEE
jgi:hypothetical protein